MKYLILLILATLLIGCSNPIDTIKKEKPMYQFRTVVSSNKTVILDTTVSSDSRVINMSSIYTASAGDLDIELSIINDSDTDTVNAVWAVETDMTTSDIVGSAIPKNSFSESLVVSLVGGTYSITLTAE